MSIFHCRMLLNNSVSALKMQLRTHTNSTGRLIPRGISPGDKFPYEILIDVVNNRRKQGIKPPNVAVITDLAKDYDDLAALLVLSELNRLGVIKLVGLIANLMPAGLRARFGRGALDLLHLQNVPIAEGTPGSTKRHKVLPYEFKNCDFMAEENNARIEPDGQVLLKRLCENAITGNEKITVILLSSLQDIDEFSRHYPWLLKSAVSDFVIQGGYAIRDNALIPDEAAANNRFNLVAASRFHVFLHDIPSVAYTKVAAFATPITSKLFQEMSETSHPLGKHLRGVQISQDLAYYNTASKEDPNDRFAPFMDQKRFLENKTSWFKSNTLDVPYPNGEDVIPHLDKVVVYDALAALGAAGLDALGALKVLADVDVQPLHRIIGVPGSPGIHEKDMAAVLSALLKGSCLAAVQKNRPSKANKIWKTISQMCR